MPTPHNPANVTPSEGYRLLDEDEEIVLTTHTPAPNLPQIELWWGAGSNWVSNHFSLWHMSTYQTRLSRSALRAARGLEPEPEKVGIHATPFEVIRSMIGNPGDENIVEWNIRHPGTGELIKCASFDEAMVRWFEGYNLPVKIRNGIKEPFETSNQRVKDYHAGKLEPEREVKTCSTPAPCTDGTQRFHVQCVETANPRQGIEVSNAASSSDPKLAATPRTHLVQSAGYWFNAGRKAQQESKHAEAFMGVENAYNHVENALYAAREEAVTLRRELEEARETNRRLNRRTQKSERRIIRWQAGKIPWRRLKQTNERIWKMVDSLVKERDSAVADNAALRDALQKAINYSDNRFMNMVWFDQMVRAMTSALSSPSPDAPLLAELERRRGGTVETKCRNCGRQQWVRHEGTSTLCQVCTVDDLLRSVHELTDERDQLESTLSTSESSATPAADQFTVILPP